MSLRRRRSRRPWRCGISSTTSEEQAPAGTVWAGLTKATEAGAPLRMTAFWLAEARPGAEMSMGLTPRLEPRKWKEALLLPAATFTCVRAIWQRSLV